jgi:hypothetical protein
MADLRDHSNAGASHLILSLEPAVSATVAELAEAVALVRADTR